MRRAAQQPALAQFIQAETEPGPAVQTEAQWEEWVRESVRTEYHPVVSFPRPAPFCGRSEC